MISEYLNAYHISFRRVSPKKRAFHDHANFPKSLKFVTEVRTLIQEYNIDKTQIVYMDVANFSRETGNIRTSAPVGRYVELDREKPRGSN